MSDRPSDGGGSARSDAASRLAALLADVVDEPEAPPPVPAPAPDGPGDVGRRPAATPPEPPAADPDATQPIPSIPSVPSADDAAASRPGRTSPSPVRPPRPTAHDGDDEVLAEARAALRAQAQPAPITAPPPGPSTGPLRKQPGRSWSRSEGTEPPSRPAPQPASPPPAPTPPVPAPAAPVRAKASPPAPAAPTLEKAPRVDAAAPAPAAPTAPIEGPPPPPPPPPAAASTPTAAPPPPPAGDDGEADDAPVGEGGVRAPRVTLRAVAFGLALALLVAAVPALGWVGKDRLLDSRGGVVVEGGIDASEPGYRALVNPTPTGLVVHRDAEGAPVSATVLSLGAADGGGTVLLMPLTLQIHEPQRTVFNTVIEAWEQTGDDDSFRRGFEDVIGVSVPPPIIDVTDESLATLVAPVAPLELTVNDPVVADDGTTFEGPVSLAADQVGPYMRATREGEPEIAHLERLRDVWAAWLEAIGEATVSEPIGGAVTGMGSFLRELADGEPVVETLDVEAGIPVTFMQAPFYVPGPNMEEQVIDAVPFPVSPRAGRRFGIKLLNGAVGETLPMPLMRDLILAGGSLSTLGNADAFGQEDTLIEYAGDDWREEAEALQELLGETAEIDEMSARRAEAEAEDMVITIGSDVLSRYQEQEDGGG
ncbi:hypothetical protein HC251_14245 [Iamia sp. SCSIO 61187]|uniref:hypothetical protein n=1 Tax=Iamia sp. SCSIO 61187 TaxID=2722752 RepID=UPI001C6366E9|nr:hypothetical protein [Iamia sp. SCSIO 61187]QYG93469.1 hypothetical protein HC251_14245 [Iamia sp. SCSIO 61187]